MRGAFANSVTGVYGYVAGVIVLGLLLTLVLPEVPLRKSNEDEPAVAAHP